MSARCDPRRGSPGADVAALRRGASAGRTADRREEGGLLVRCARPRWATSDTVTTEFSTARRRSPASFLQHSLETPGPHPAPSGYHSASFVGKRCCYWSQTMCLIVTNMPDSGSEACRAALVRTDAPKRSGRQDAVPRRQARAAQGATGCGQRQHQVGGGRRGPRGLSLRSAEPGSGKADGPAATGG